MDIRRKSFWLFTAKLAVATLLLLLLFYAIEPHYSSDPRQARRRATRADITSLQIAIDEFQKDCGRYPTTAERLDALLSCPTSLTRWRGPYFKDCSALPNDPWDHPYVYVCPGVHNTKGFDLYSCGPDGITHTGGNDPDDINNWTPSRQ